MPWLRPDDLEIAAGSAESSPAASLCPAGRRAAGLSVAEFALAIGRFGARKCLLVFAPAPEHSQLAAPLPQPRVPASTDPPPLSGWSFRADTQDSALQTFRPVAQNILARSHIGPAQTQPGPRPPMNLRPSDLPPASCDTRPARDSIAVCAAAVAPRFSAA